MTEQIKFHKSPQKLLSQRIRKRYCKSLRTSVINSRYVCGTTLRKTLYKEVIVELIPKYVYKFYIKEGQFFA